MVRKEATVSWLGIEASEASGGDREKQKTVS